MSRLAVLWLLLLTGEMMKWAHLSSFQENAIAAAQLTLTSGVAAVVLTAVAYGLTLKGLGYYRKYRKVSLANAWTLLQGCHSRAGLIVMVYMKSISTPASLGWEAWICVSQPKERSFSQVKAIKGSKGCVCTGLTL